MRRAVGPRWSTGLRWPRLCLGTFRSFGRSAMSARVTERIGWGRGARGAYRSVRSRVGRVWERGMGSCEVGAIRYGSRVFYGRDLLGRILGSESRSYLGVEIGSRVEIVSRFRCVDFSRFVEVTSCLNSRLIKFGSIVFSRTPRRRQGPDALTQDTTNAYASRPTTLITWQSHKTLTQET